MVIVVVYWYLLLRDALVLDLYPSSLHYYNFPTLYVN